MSILPRSEIDWRRWHAWNEGRDPTGYWFCADWIEHANCLRDAGRHDEADAIVERMSRTDRCRKAVTWR